MDRVRFTAVVAVALVAAVATSSRAHACTCTPMAKPSEPMQPNPFQEHDGEKALIASAELRADLLLFAGTVRSATIWQLPPPPGADGGGPSNQRWYVIDVERVWTGPAFETIAVYSPWSIAACGAELDEGEKILAKAYQRAPFFYEGAEALDKLWSVGNCSVLDYDPADVAALDRFHPPLELAAIDESDPRLSPPIIAVAEPPRPEESHRYWLWWAIGGVLAAAIAAGLLARRRGRG